MALQETKTEQEKAQPFGLEFRGFSTEHSDDEVRKLTRRIFDFKYVGEMDPNIINPRNPNGDVMAFGIVVSERSQKPESELSDLEKETLRLVEAHFVSGAPLPKPTKRKLVG